MGQELQGAVPAPDPHDRLHLRIEPEVLEAPGQQTVGRYSQGPAVEDLRAALDPKTPIREDLDAALPGGRATQLAGAARAMVSPGSTGGGQRQAFRAEPPPPLPYGRNRIPWLFLTIFPGPGGKTGSIEYPRREGAALSRPTALILFKLNLE